ncbi:ferredoxin--NADP reductase [Anseongella ginsenosidimutans]|nr:ferredoxin--NADP reductase [Anseongella ginsenosidimutans]
MKGYLILRIRQIIRETPDAATFVLEQEDGSPVRYRAGQFLTLIFERHGKEVRRSYSLSSSPGIDAGLRITVKQMENGEFSRYLLSRLKPGDCLKALSPAGRFTFPDSFSGPADVFLLAAGSGIVPVFSILKMLLTSRPDLKITLVYSNYNEESTIFRKEIDALSRDYSQQFHYIHILSQPHRVAVNVIHGHLNNLLLERLVEKHLHFERSEALFFICGPFTYMRMVQITLRVAGFRDEQLRKENFVVNEPVPPRFTFPEGPYPKEVFLDVSGEAHRLQLSRGQTVLEAALQAGLNLPYSCKAGVCATCTARCSQGEVKMAVNEVLTSADLERGLVLTCVAFPVTQKVHIEIEI